MDISLRASVRLIYRWLDFFFLDLSEAVDVYSDWIDACEQANA